jgi:hypothetical protein
MDEPIATAAQRVIGAIAALRSKQKSPAQGGARRGAEYAPWEGGRISEATNTRNETP